MGVGTDNAARGDGVSGEGDFIAGGENPHTRAPMYRKPRVIAGRRQADIPRGQAPAWGEQRFALSKIQPAPAHPAPARDSFLDQHRAIRGFSIFLKQNRIRARWDKAAGENPHSLAGADFARKGCPAGAAPITASLAPSTASAARTA